MSTHGFCSPFLGVRQVPGKPGRHPRRCLRRVFQEVAAGNFLCVFIAALFLSQHNSHKLIGVILKNLCVCDRNSLPWILEHGHTAQFLNDPTSPESY